MRSFPTIPRISYSRKICGFIEEFEKVGEKIKGAHASFDNASNKLVDGRGSVVKQAEMLKNLGIDTTKSIPRRYKKSIEE